MLDGVYQRKPCSLDHFQTVWAAKHDISLVSCYLRSARRFCGSCINEKLRCIKPLPSLTVALPGIITNYRKNMFPDASKWCTVFCNSAEHRDGGGVDFGKQDKGTSAHPFFKSNAQKKNQGWQGKSEILINNSGFRAINRQCWIFRTLEGWSQLRWRRTGS